MSQVIIGVFILFGLVMAMLLFFIIVFTAAILIFAGGDKQKNPEGPPSGQLPRADV